MSEKSMISQFLSDYWSFILNITIFIIVICVLQPGMLKSVLVQFGLATPSLSATASHILVKDEKQCQELKDAIKDNWDTFGEMARKHSQCPSGKSGGSLGKFSQGNMVPAFDRVIFDPKSEMNKVYGPVQTHFGYHLIMIQERDNIPEKSDKDL